MDIEKLDDFAENGDKNLTGIDIQQGFIQSEKPARQWFNFIFNSIIKKTNEIIDGLSLTQSEIDNLEVGTERIVDGSVTTEKLSSDIEITGENIVKDANLKTPRLLGSYAITTLDAPNINLAADGTLKRSNDPLNASTRKVGTASGNLAERNASGRVVGVEAIGVGQNWQDVTSSRVVNTTYTNSTTKPIMVYVYFGLTTTGSAFLVDGVATMSSSSSAGTSGQVIVPVGSTYKAQANFTTWTELR